MARKGDGLTLRGRTWYLDCRLNGQRFVTRLGKNISRSVAAELAQVKRAAFLKQEAGIGGKKRDIAFEGAREEFLRWAKSSLQAKTVRDYSQCLKELARSFKGKKLSAICQLDIERHKSKRVADKARVRANREIALLKNVFNRCREWHLFDGLNPVVGVKLLPEPKQRLRYLEHDEEARLLAHCTEPLRSLLIVAINTGVRIESEALRLKWRDVDLRRKLLTVPAAFAKSGKTRTVPLNARALAALEHLKTNALSEFVFHDKVGVPYYGMLDKPFAAALKAAGLEKTGVSAHVMRHTFCSRLVMAGVDLRTVQELGGWSDLSLVQRYSHLAPGHKADAVERIAVEFHNGIHTTAEQPVDTNLVSVRKLKQAPVAQLDRAAVS